MTDLDLIELQEKPKRKAAKPIQLRVDADLHRQIRLASKAERRSITTWVIMACEDKLKAANQRQE